MKNLFKKSKTRKENPEELTKKELVEFRQPQEAIFIYSYDSYQHGYKETYKWWGCPRCKKVIERDGQQYCGNCGQHISWKNFYNQHRRKLWRRKQK